MPTLIAIIVGALIGATAGQHPITVLIGGFIGWLTMRSIAQQQRISRLQAALDALASAATTPAQGALARLQSGTNATDGTSGIGARAATDAAAATGAGTGPAATLAGDSPIAARTLDMAPAAFDTLGGCAVSLVNDHRPVGHAGPPGGCPRWAERSRSGRATARARPVTDPFGPLRRWLFGGNTIVKAGVGILFIGLAFLAKYASEHVQVPVELRLASIGGVALALLFVGWHLRLKRPDYAQVLQGGAVAALYLTLFVAFKFYGVLAVGPVFALMVAVATLAAALAVLQDARSLAVIGALGGFAAPILVSTGSGNYVALFSYYLVLDLGIAMVAWYRTWRSLNLVGFFGTFIVGTAWGVLKYRPEDFAASESFLIGFFALFVAIMLMPMRRLGAANGSSPRQGAPDGDGSGMSRAGTSVAFADRWANSTLLFGLPTVVFALQYGLVRDTHYGTALSALALAAFYVGVATLTRARPQLGLAFDASLAIGTVFLTLVIPFALDARSTAGAWAFEAAGLVWIGLRQRRLLPRVFGYALLLMAGFSMLIAHRYHGVSSEPFNAYLFNGLMAAAASLAAAWFVRRYHDRLAGAKGEEALEPLLIACGTLWLLASAALEIDTFVPAWYLVSALIVTGSAITLLYAALEARLGWRMIGWPALAHSVFLLLMLAGGYFVVESPLDYGGWWAWPVALLAHLGVLRWVAPHAPTWARRMAHANGVLVVALFGALEGRSLTAELGDAMSAWPWLGWLVVPAGVLLWLPRPASVRQWPMRDEPAAYRSVAASIIAAALLLWTIVANFASDGSAQPLPHIPLLNPLDIGIAIALVASALWWRSGAAGPVTPTRQRDAGALLGVVSFVWLNAILVRGFHHYGGVPYRIEAWTASLAVQTGLTLLWTVTALVAMWLSARRAARLPWMAGAALLAAVVLKLLLVDLSGSGTITRIVSFVGVGVLMLVIGYVAPPPSRDRHAVA